MFVTLSPMQPEPTVRDRLLDATFEVASTHGLSRLSVGDVAKAAGLSRQTLYKHFGSREDLISQTVLREAGRLVEGALAAAEDEPDPMAALEGAIAEALRRVRSHPLLDRLVATEPEALLPLLIDGDSSVLSAVDLICRQMLEERLPHLDEASVRAAADLLSRMLVSYSVRPPADQPEVVARSLALALWGSLGAPGHDDTSLAPTRTPATPPAPATR